MARLLNEHQIAMIEIVKDLYYIKPKPNYEFSGNAKKRYSY